MYCYKLINDTKFYLLKNWNNLIIFITICYKNTRFKK